MDLTIRPAQIQDHEAIVRMARKVVEEGSTYVFPPETTNKQLLDYWLNEKKCCFVACAQGQTLGVFCMGPNQIGRGSHVANASYLVDNSARGLGLGRKMAEFSMETARELGFEAMQFNIVVASNHRAVGLWQDLGFEIVGTVPKAFLHPRDGYVAIHIMWRML